MDRSPARQPSGRWAGSWRTWELPELVRQVAVAVVPQDPQTLGARQYDRERAGVGFVDAPSANAIRARLRAPSWRVLLETIFSDTADIYQELWRWRESVVQERFTSRDVREAVRAVAAFLGQNTLRPGEYAQGRLGLLERSRANRLWLPTLMQLMYYGDGLWDQGGDWSALLRNAGLDPAWSVPVARGLTVPEALDACVSAHGTLPTKAELRRFVAANGLAMIDGSKARLGPAERAELQRRRTARGLSTPAALPALDRRPDYDTPVPTDRIPAELRALKRRARYRHTTESVQQMMRAFLDQAPDELTPVALLYRDFAARTDGAPGFGVLTDRFGGFGPTRDAALAERVTSRRGDAGVQSAAAHPYKGDPVTSKRPQATQQESHDSAAGEF